MFIKIWQLTILYIDRMDWRAGHLTTTEGRNEGRGICQQTLPAGLSICTSLSNARGMAEGLPGGMLAAGTDTHISSS